MPWWKFISKFFCCKEKISNLISIDCLFHHHWWKCKFYLDINLVPWWDILCLSINSLPWFNISSLDINFFCLDEIISTSTSIIPPYRFTTVINPFTSVIKSRPWWNIFLTSIMDFDLDSQVKAVMKHFLPRKFTLAEADVRQGSTLEG